MCAGKGGHHHKCTHSRTVKTRAQQDSLPQQSFIPPQIQGGLLTWLPFMSWTSTDQEREAGSPECSVCSGPERQVGSAGRLGTEEKAFENNSDSYYL